MCARSTALLLQSATFRSLTSDRRYRVTGVGRNPSVLNHPFRRPLACSPPFAGTTLRIPSPARRFVGDFVSRRTACQARPTLQEAPENTEQHWASGVKVV